MTTATPSDAPLPGSARTVAALLLGHIMALGTMFYPPVLTMPLIAAHHNWSITFTMIGFTTALVVAELVSHIVGNMVDRHGGHWVMLVGCFIGACGLVGMAFAFNHVTYLLVWGVLGIAMSTLFYNSAFATIGRIYGTQARKPITTLAILCGFSSTVSWPATHFFVSNLGWRRTYFVFALLLVTVAAPVLFFALPRSRADGAPSHKHGSASSPKPTANYWTVVLLAAAFAFSAFMFSGLATHLLAIFERLGLDRGTAVTIGLLLGPAQVAARVGEFMFGRGVHPLMIVRCAVGLLCTTFAVLAVLGLSVSTAVAVVVVLAFANGAMTIARGTLPLALFGPNGYSKLVGKHAGPTFIMQSIGPLAVAFAAERGSDALAMTLVGAVAFAVFLCLLSIRREQNSVAANSVTPAVQPGRCAKAISILSGG